MARTLGGSLEAREVQEFMVLVGREVQAVEQEESAMAGLTRVTALRFADGVRFPVPEGNRLRTAGDLAEIRALLAGWPRAAAMHLKQHFGPAPPGPALDAVEAVLAAWARDPELASADPLQWPTTASAAP